MDDSHFFNQCKNSLRKMRVELQLHYKVGARTQMPHSYFLIRTHPSQCTIMVTNDHGTYHQGNCHNGSLD